MLPRFSVKTPPTEEPVSVEELRSHIRITGIEQDADLQSYGIAARESAEIYTDCAFVTQTLTMYLDEFPHARAIAPREFSSLSVPSGYGTCGIIEVRRSPLQSVTSIKYLDTAGLEQTVDPANYVVDAVSIPPRIAPKRGFFWPVALAQLNSVYIEMIVGFGVAEDVPESIKAAIKMTAAELYENRENSSEVERINVPLNVQWLLDKYKIHAF